MKTQHNASTSATLGGGLGFILFSHIINTGLSCINTVNYCGHNYHVCFKEVITFHLTDVCSGNMPFMNFIGYHSASLLFIT